MFVLYCEILIGDHVFKQVHDVKITKSVDLLSDTAEIKLPISAMFENRDGNFIRKKLVQEIKVGDKVEIKLAYKDVFEKVEFIGYIVLIEPNTPTITLKCEDGIYILRQKNIKKNFGKTTLKDILKYIIEGTGIELADNIPDMPFTKFIIKNKNGAKALQDIKSNYLLNIYIDDDNKLFTGLKYVNGIKDEVNYVFNRNIIKHSLKFINKEDIKLYVKVIGVRRDDTKVVVFIGDKIGEARVLHFYNVSDVDTLKQIGKAELDSLKYTGYHGNIQSFLVPYANRGMSANVKDDNYPERQGKYFIEKVVITFGQNGARRNVYLGVLIDKETK